MIKIIALAVSTLFFLLTPVSAATKATIVSAPSSIQLDTPFDVQVSINGESNTSYYTKGRIGVNSTSLTKGITYNPNNAAPDDWLTDNDGWSKFPMATTDEGGSWSGSLKLKTASTATIGDNLLVFRMRKVGVTTNYDSESHTISLSASPSPTPSLTPSPTPLPTSTPAPKSKTITTTSKTPAPTINPTTPPPTSDTTTTPKPTISKTTINYQTTSVAAVATSPTPSVKVEIKSQKQTNYFVWAGLVLIFTGGLSIGYIYLRKNASIHITFRKRD